MEVIHQQIKTELKTQSIDPREMKLEQIMRREVVSIDMDATLSEALDLCMQSRIRHLPVTDESGRLVGMLTDRDIRYYLSPRLGTISENSADRAMLERRVHVIMVRKIVIGTPDMSLASAARKMLQHRVGSLPIIDAENMVVGIVTANDFLVLMASSEPVPGEPEFV